MKNNKPISIRKRKPVWCTKDPDTHQKCLDNALVYKFWEYKPIWDEGDQYWMPGNHANFGYEGEMGVGEFECLWPHLEMEGGKDSIQKIRMEKN